MTDVRRLGTELIALGENHGHATRLRYDSMITTWFTTLSDLGEEILDAFLLPGEFILSQFVTHAPSSASQLGIGTEGDGALLPAVLSLLIWLLLVFVLFRLVALLQNAARFANAVIRTIGFRAWDAIRGIKTKLICALRRLIPLQGPGSANTITEVELDNLDLAVLRTGAAKGPDFALSAPELADQFTLRPAQVQRSLDKLRDYRLIDSVIGSTDGFDNYRLTRSAVTFLATWQRRR